MQEQETRLENLAAGDILFTADEKTSINAIISGHEIKGNRCFGDPQAAHVWG
ncbi:hypothetical protein SCP_1601290 [Sparassis crispa]|uniref:Uncharacterized protein n=1 Tax=Sparassis crispa TaxID=139825 RepID=A0A401H4V9_9APHY|nr:hypothetical protein SCP_1601290 [Sparassis crispa]GBE89467.1 hypothetical protein SCP_1601290 [Sparassis crispa]